MKKILFVMLLLCPLAHSFTVEPGFVRPAGVVTYACEPELLEDFLAAFAIWNAALDNRFTLQPAAIPNIDVSTVVLPGNALGRTRYAMPSMRCLVEISPDVDPVLEPGSFYRRAIILHELGHALGLGHSDRISAIMYFALFPGRTATLSFDDIFGIRSIYSLASDIQVIATPRKHFSHWVDLVLSGDINNEGVLWEYGDGLSKSLQDGSSKHYYVRSGYYTVTATVDGVPFQVTFYVGRPKKVKPTRSLWTKRIEPTTKQP